MKHDDEYKLGSLKDAEEFARKRDHGPRYKWTDRATCTYYHEADSGRIVASLSRISLGDDIWHADVHGDALGQYISWKHAKAAVERFIENQDKQAECPIKEVFCETT